ncbi:MAG: thermonuclease family protein [Deltaproteobacteria bacterium]|jgi:endonuclease YncB( thermonuclease family)|nr:thermonuclease family protein [Deltaproteobacteria bacterium]
MLKRFTLTLILVLLASGGTSPAADAGSLRVKVHWVDDGDTIVVAGGERVRYLGINTPEVAHKDEPGEPFGDEAKAFNKKLVQGRWINLELAEQQRDPYGRLLAYVFLADGTFVNGELVRQGYAHLLRKQPKLRYWERLLALQRQALKKKKGMWSLPVVKPEKFYIGNKRSWIFHRPHCQFGRKTAAGNRLRFRDRYEALYHGFSPGRRCKP